MVRRISTYIHEQPDWPQLRWNSASLAGVLADVRHRQGRLLGQMEALGFNLREEAVLRTLTEDVVKSSEIEGEKLDPKTVRSSIARRCAPPTFNCSRVRLSPTLRWEIPSAGWLHQRLPVTHAIQSLISR